MLDAPVPVPGPGELLVRVLAAAVNLGDAKMREGAYGDVPLPAVLGRELAGVVERVGPGVTGVAEGDAVFGGTPDLLGAWAERALLDADFAAPLPAGVDPATAAVLPVAAGTAFDALAQLALPARRRCLRPRGRRRAARGGRARGRPDGPSVADRPLVARLGGSGVSRAPSARVLAQLGRLVADGRLDPHVTETFALRDAGRALARVETGCAEGKIVLRVPGDRPGR